ncbi:MAG: hypothetical protein AAB871_02085 [Patescibacteria group bacterium]
MIDIPTPQSQIISNSRKPEGKKWHKTLLIVLFVVLAGVAGWAIYFFLVNSNTVSLKEGENHDYQNYILTVDRVFLYTCPQVPNFNCKDWKDEPGAQIHYTNKSGGSVTYAYLGISTSKELNEQGLRLELLSVDLDSKEIKIKLKTD